MEEEKYIPTPIEQLSQALANQIMAELPDNSKERLYALMNLEQCNIWVIQHNVKERIKAEAEQRSVT